MRIPVQTVTIGAAAQYLAAGAAGSWGLSLTATQDGAAAVGVGVAWSTTGSGFTLAPAMGTDGGEWDGGGGGAGGCDCQRVDERGDGMRVDECVRELDGVWRGGVAVDDCGFEWRRAERGEGRVAGGGDVCW